MEKQSTAINENENVKKDREEFSDNNNEKINDDDDEWVMFLLSSHLK